MSDEKINELLERILSATESEDIWKEQPSIFTSDTRKYFDMKISDNNHLKIKAEVKIESKNVICILTSKITLEHPDLIDDRLYIYAVDNKLVKKIITLILQKHIDFAPADQNSVMDSIIDSIGTKKTRRKEKLSKILDGEKKVTLIDKLKDIFK